MVITMREKDIEKELTARTKAMGGIAPKLTSPGFDGMPDRLVLLPGGRMGFVELQSTGQKAKTASIGTAQTASAAWISRCM